jgi:hypothetical protein
MGAPITPQVNIETNRYNEHLMRKKHYPYEVPYSRNFRYKTYRKLKADLKRLMKEYSVNECTVYRSLRGEWGERWEHWHLQGKKLVLGKDGWS